MKKFAVALAGALLGAGGGGVVGFILGLMFGDLVTHALGMDIMVVVFFAMVISGIIGAVVGSVVLLAEYNEEQGIERHNLKVLREMMIAAGEYQRGGYTALGFGEKIIDLCNKVKAPRR